ncbi:Homeobox protein tos8 [Marasmius tenuissimus]|uniref:Homeobox protein tos8 n=1 Tax=Marasmius tenuissimus TaxID=585030 RepID=A0ABR2ZCW0_9AGAR
MNVLVCDEGHCRISDFGLCTIEDDSPTGRVSESTSQAAMRGSVPWLAPELMNPGCVESPNRTTRDIYALGCTMYEVFAGNPPFSDRKMDLQIILAVLNGMRPSRPAECTDQLWMIIERCWSEESGSRLIASQVVALLVEPALTALSAPSNISVVHTKEVELVGRVEGIKSHPEDSPSRAKPLLPTSSIPRRQDEVSPVCSSRKRGIGEVDSPIESEPLAKRCLPSPLGGNDEHWDVTIRDEATEQEGDGGYNWQAYPDSKWRWSDYDLPTLQDSLKCSNKQPRPDSECDDIADNPTESDEGEDRDGKQGKTKRERLLRASWPDECNEYDQPENQYQGDELPPFAPEPKQDRIDFYSSHSKGGTQEDDDLLDLLGLRSVVSMTSIFNGTIDTTDTRGSEEQPRPHGQSDDAAGDVAESSNRDHEENQKGKRRRALPTLQSPQGSMRIQGRHRTPVKKRITPPKREHLLAEIQKRAETIEKLMAQLAEEEKSEQNFPWPSSSTSGDVFGPSSSNLPPSSGSPLDEPPNEMSGEENRVVEDWIVKARESWTEFGGVMGVGGGTPKRHIGEGGLADSSSEDEDFSDDDDDTDGYDIEIVDVDFDGSSVFDSVRQKSRAGSRRGSTSSTTSLPQPSRYSAGAEFPAIPDEAAPFGLMAEMSLRPGRNKVTHSFGSDSTQDDIWDDISVQDAWKSFRGRVGTSELVGVPSALRV